LPAASQQWVTRPDVLLHKSQYARLPGIEEASVVLLSDDIAHGQESRINQAIDRPRHNLCSDGPAGLPPDRFS